jgi:hypothetical protein
VRPRSPTDDGPPITLGRTDWREPLLNFEQRLEMDETRVTRQGWQRNGLCRSTSTDLCALGRIRGLEYKGPRHLGKQQVERHIDEDC